MFLLQLEEPQPASLLARAWAMIRYFIRGTSSEKPKTVIDLASANQAVWEHRNGYTPAFMQRAIRDSLPCTRGDLLRKRYLRILEEEAMQKKKDKLPILPAS